MENDPGPVLRPGYGPRPTPAEPAAPLLSAARNRVLDAVREASTGTVAELERSTGLHGNTLRGHLDALVTQGVVRRARAEPSGRGRPAWVYEAVPTRPGRTSGEYAGLAAALARHLHRTSSAPWQEAVEAGRTWGHDLAARSGAPESRTPRDARRRVLDILDDIGFAPEADEPATTARLPCCPLLDTAKEYPDVVCGVHLGIVRGALEAYGAEASGTELLPFAEPGACRLHLVTDRGQ